MRVEASGASWGFGMLKAFKVCLVSSVDLFVCMSACGFGRLQSYPRCLKLLCSGSSSLEFFNFKNFPNPQPQTLNPKPKP